MRVLISAYACIAGRGSEWGAGWAWAYAAAQNHDVWLLTHAENAAGVDRVLSEDKKLAARLHPVYLQNPPWARWLRRKRSTHYIYYFIWQLVVCRREARRLHSTVGFEVAHHVTYSSDWSPAGVSKLPGVPFVWGPVGGSSTPASPRLWILLGARTFVAEFIRVVLLGICRLVIGRPLARRAAVVLGQNAHVARAFAPVSVSVEPQIALGVDEDYGTRQVDSLGWPVAVFAGRLLAWKGVRLALAALRRPEASDWRLQIYGDGPRRARLERLAVQWGIADRVDFLGQRPREEVLRALSRASVFFFPSIHDSSGWVVAEAMAAGCPVLCLDAGGPPNLVGPGDGVVVPLHSDVIGRLAAGLNHARQLRPRRDQWSARRLPDLLNELYSGLVSG